MTKQWFILLNLSFLFFISNTDCGADEFENTAKLLVKGEASLYKPADQMEVSLGVLTSAKTSTQALDENRQHIRQIVANLNSLGLDESDYQTGRFHIQPIYQKLLKDSEESDQRKIIHYEALNTILIKTQKITLADKILTAAVQGGANQIEQVYFSLNNPQTYREEGIKLATQNALADAHSLSSAAGVKLKQILNISLDHWQNLPRPYLVGKQAMRSNALGENQGSIDPGQTEIHAVVNITFEIAPD